MSAPENSGMDSTNQTAKPPAPSQEPAANVTRSIDGALANMQRQQTPSDVPQQNVSRSITINVDENGRIINDVHRVEFLDVVAKSRMPSPVQEELGVASVDRSGSSDVEVPFEVSATYQTVKDPSNLNPINTGKPSGISRFSMSQAAAKMRWPQNLTTPTHCQFVSRSLTLPVDNEGYILQDPLDVMESAQDILKSGKKIPAPVLDPSLLFGMERTLFSAWNVGMMIQIFGSGLWMAHPNDKDVHFLGALLIFIGILFIAGSYSLHLWRIHRLKSGKSAPAYSSEVWTGILCFILTSALVMELVYAAVYPYLLRSVPVTIAEAT